MAKPKRKVIKMGNGDRVEIVGDRVEYYPKGPIVFHRKQWVRYLMPAEEARRTLLDSIHNDIMHEALTKAFSNVPMKIYDEDGDGGSRHYDSQGYCDNPGRGY